MNLFYFKPPIHFFPATVGAMVITKRTVMFRAIGNTNNFNDIVSIGQRIKEVRQMPLSSPLERELRMQAAKEVAGDVRMENLVSPNVPPARWDRALDKLTADGPTVNEQRYAARSLEYIRAENTEGIYLDMQEDADLVAPEIESDIPVNAGEYNNYLLANELRQYQDASRDGKAVFYLQSEDDVVLPEAVPPIEVDRDWEADTARESIVKKFQLLRDSIVDGESLVSEPSAVARALAGNPGPGVGGNPKLPPRVATKIADLTICDNKIYIFPENHPAVPVFENVIERQRENLKRPVVAEIAAGISFDQVVDALNQFISFFL